MQDERFVDVVTFDEVAEMIQESEDRLSARIAKKERKPMSDARLQMILNYAVGAAAMVMGFVAAFMIIYYIGR